MIHRMPDNWRFFDFSHGTVEDDSGMMGIVMWVLLEIQLWFSIVSISKIG